MSFRSPNPSLQTKMTATLPASANLAPQWIARGSNEYLRVSIGLFLAGFATFALLYCVQPLLPVFAQEFGIGATESSLSLSLPLACLAIAIFFAGALSEGLGRRGLIFSSVGVAAVLNIVAAFIPDWHLFLAVRALEGFAMGGVPAVGMAYLAEEIDPKGLGLAMGLYVAGNAFGGMTGRVTTGIIAENFSLRAALVFVGLAGITAAAGCAALLPPSRNFIRRKGFDAAFHIRAWMGHLRNPALIPLFVIAFLAMGSFVTIYNYAGFRLIAPPYNLSQTEIGLIFTVYVFGIASSSTAGALADRISRYGVLVTGILIASAGVALTILPGLAAMVIGIILLTVGFFMAHAVASAWTSLLAPNTKGHATSLYLLAYYLGSSIIGSAGGWFWTEGGWSAVALFTLVALGCAFLSALRMRRL